LTKIDKYVCFGQTTSNSKRKVILSIGPVRRALLLQGTMTIFFENFTSNWAWSREPRGPTIFMISRLARRDFRDAVGSVEEIIGNQSTGNGWKRQPLVST